mgnify:CR=1 FL=1
MNNKRIFQDVDGWWVVDISAVIYPDCHWIFKFYADAKKFLDLVNTGKLPHEAANLVI